MCVYIYANSYVSIHIYPYTHICPNIWILMWVFAFTDLHTNAYMEIYRPQIHTCVCMCLYKLVHLGKMSCFLFYLLVNFNHN